MDDVNGYACNCSLGWTGRHCDENVDECETNPCENNSTCSDLVPGYNCSCAAGWSGARCQVDIGQSVGTVYGSPVIHYDNTRADNIQFSHKSKSII